MNKQSNADRISARSLRTYANLKPLAPEDDQQQNELMPKHIRTPAGQWKADIPSVRWVFDLGANAA